MRLENGQARTHRGDGIDVERWPKTACRRYGAEPRGCDNRTRPATNPGRRCPGVGNGRLGSRYGRYEKFQRCSWADARGHGVDAVFKIANWVIEDQDAYEEIMVAATVAAALEKGLGDDLVDFAAGKASPGL